MRLHLAQRFGGAKSRNLNIQVCEGLKERKSVKTLAAFDLLWGELEEKGQGNQRFGEFVGKQVNELRLELGAPTEDFINELGNETLVYKTKKYGIPCERKFKISANRTIVGFTSSGCI